MWWYLWKQKPIGPINLSVSTHLISSPKQKKMIKQNKKKELKKKHHPFKNTTKYYYYIYLYDKTENYNYDISIYILWFMFRSIEKKKKITAWNRLAKLFGPFVDSFSFLSKFIALQSLIPPTTFSIKSLKMHIPYIKWNFGM